MDLKPSLVANFTVPTTSGSRYLLDFFPKKNVRRIDSAFRKFVDGVNLGYAAGDFACRLFQTTKGGSSDYAIQEALGPCVVDANRVCVLLDYLAGTGSSFLFIPPGEEEVNIILGYALVKGVHRVLFVEHEFEHGVREIHLHARKLNEWGDDAPMVIVVDQPLA